MVKKIVIAVLVSTIVIAVGLAFFENQQPAAASSNIEVIQQPTVMPQNQKGQGAGNGTGPIQQQQSVSEVGEPWISSGTIVSLDAVGLTLALADGNQVYLELGPTAYWQGQGVTLNPGETITINSFFNGEQYHAGTVTTVSGTQINLRNVTGQPLWSGSNGGQGGQGNGGTDETAIPAEAWETMIGTVTAVNTNGLTIQTEAGVSYTFQFGRADFWQSQAVTFTVGDAVSAQGFWQGTQFQVGQITKTATGERLLLRDPNGRPLWGGPGRTGSGTGNNNAGAAGAAASGSAQGSGQGRQWRGGRG